MKKIFLLLALAFLTFSCSKNEDSSGNNKKTIYGNTPNPDYDEYNFGLYKGVVMDESGTSGNIVINIYNDGDVDSDNDGIVDTDEDDNVIITGGEVKASLVIGDVTYNFTTDEEILYFEDIPYIVFKDESGINSFEFFVFDDGTDPYIENLLIEGQTGTVGVVAKEESKHNVICYEGKYLSGGNTKGYINLVRKISDPTDSGDYDTYIGLCKSLVDIDFTEVTKEIQGDNSDGSIYVDVYDLNITFYSLSSGNTNLQGDWENYYDDTKGGWLAPKTLD